MKPISVIYAPDMDFNVGTNTFPIGIKGRLVTTTALASGLSIRIVPPHPMDRAGIKLAHDSEYVDAVLDLRRDNGLFNRDPAVARALPYHCDSRSPGRCVTPNWSSSCISSSVITALAPHRIRLLATIFRQTMCH